MSENHATDKPCRGEQVNPASGFEVAELPCCTNDIGLSFWTKRPLTERAMPIPSSGLAIFRVPQEDGFQFGRFARQMNYAANAPIIAVTMKMLHQLHTDKCED
jgi:hypothetical protein